MSPETASCQGREIVAKDRGDPDKGNNNCGTLSHPDPPQKMSTNRQWPSVTNGCRLQTAFPQRPPRGAQWGVGYGCCRFRRLSVTQCGRAPGRAVCDRCPLRQRSVPRECRSTWYPTVPCRCPRNPRRSQSTERGVSGALRMGLPGQDHSRAGG